MKKVEYCIEEARKQLQIPPEQMKESLLIPKLGTYNLDGFYKII